MNTDEKNTKRSWLIVGVLTVGILFSGFAFSFHPGGQGPGVAAQHPGLSLATTAALSGWDWPSYLQGPTRTASNTGESVLSPSNAAQIRQLWSYKTDGPVFAQPAVAKGVLYVGSWDGFEYSINSITGALQWKTFVGKDNLSTCSPLGVTSSATVANGTVYVGGGDGYFYALNAANGTILWKTLIGNVSLGYYNWASPLLVGKFAYMGVASDCDNPLVPGGLRMISLSSHATVRYFNTTSGGQLGNSIWSSPAFNPATNTIYVTTGNPKKGTVSPYSEAIVALNASTLAVKSSWKVPANQTHPDGDFGATPTIITPSAGKTLVVATNKNGLTYAFNASNLSSGPVWQYRISTNASIAPAAWGNHMVFVPGTGTILNGVSVKGAVRALSPLTGKVVWAKSEWNLIQVAPAFSNGLLAVASGHHLDVINASNGKTLNSFTSLRAFISAPVFSHGILYAASTDRSIHAYGLPLTARASVAPTPAVVSSTLSFNGSASRGFPPYQYLWNFADGSNSTSAMTTHVYSSDGSYSPTFTAIDSAGYVSTVAIPVTIYRPLTISASISTNATLAGTDVAFTGNATFGSPPYLYLWSFGDGSTASTAIAHHNYTAAGTYLVTFTANDSTGSSSSISFTVKVYQRLSISANASASRALIGSNLGFSSQVSNGSAPYQYSWAFGDSSTSSDSSSLHNFSSAGTYNVSLTVQDSLGENQTAFLVVTVAQHVTANASVASSVAVVNSPVNFSGVAAFGFPGYVYAWDLGDGSNGSSSNVGHSYSAAGSYNVTFSVIDSAGYSAQARLSLLVVNPLNGTLTADSTNGSAPMNVTFWANVSGGEGTYNYTWTNNGTDLLGWGPVLQLSFSQAGSYSIVVSVLDSSGLTWTSSIVVRVN